jgi:hypothetical protein
MTRTLTQSDRRQLPRTPGLALAVSLRPRGRLGSLTVQALDFNRYGIAVLCGQALMREHTVFLSVACDQLRVDQLVGIVHNCVHQGERYRIGIRFRLNSQLQRDRSLTERLLSCLEAAALAAVRGSP